MSSKQIAHIPTPKSIHLYAGFYKYDSYVEKSRVGFVLYNTKSSGLKIFPKLKERKKIYSVDNLGVSQHNGLQIS